MKNGFVKVLSLVFVFVLLTSLSLPAFAEEDESGTPPLLIAPNPNAADAEEEADAGFTFTLDRLPANLGRMGTGMACIIIVMGILIVVTMFLNKVTAPKDKK